MQIEFHSPPRVDDQRYVTAPSHPGPGTPARPTGARRQVDRATYLEEERSDNRHSSREARHQLASTYSPPGAASGARPRRSCSAGRCRARALRWGPSGVC